MSLVVRPITLRASNAYVAQLHRHHTYTLPEEGGASLRAAGWVLVEQCAGGGTWEREGRERPDEDHPLGIKWRWEHPPLWNEVAA